MTKQAERKYAETIDNGHLYRKPYESARHIREYSVALELLSRYVPAGPILDLGCGPGWTSLFLARAGYDVWGVDISERMIEIARERSVREGAVARFEVADIEEFQLDRQDFHGALLFDALHHCPQYKRVLRRAWEHLRPGGWLVALEPSWLHRISPHARSFSRRHGVTELGFWRWSITRDLRRAGFGKVVQYYDTGMAVRGLLGVLGAYLRLTLTFLQSWPRMKLVVAAQK